MKRFQQPTPQREQQRIALSGLLEKITALTPGNKITEPDVYFEVSVPVNNIRFSQDKDIISGTLTLQSHKKKENSVIYEIHSPDGNSLMLVSNAMDYPCIDWTLEGGTPSKGNETGDYYLKLSLSNYIRGSEARISMVQSKKAIQYN